MEVRRLCARKEEIYGKLLGNHKPPVVPGVPMFLETLVKHNVRLRRPASWALLLCCFVCAARIFVACILYRQSDIQVLRMSELAKSLVSTGQ